MKSDWLMRTARREIAMRISVIIAISCDSPTIEKSHAEWAINYVDELQQCNVSHLAGKLADTPSNTSRMRF